LGSTETRASREENHTSEREVAASAASENPSAADIGGPTILVIRSTKMVAPR